MMFISLSDLVKRSAMQMVFKSLNPDKVDTTPTKNQIKGNEHARSVNISDYVEMGGKIDFDDFSIGFSADELIPLTKLKHIEIKSVFGKYEQWYFNQSILQTAVYHCFIKNCEIFRTSFFMKNVKIQEFEKNGRDVDSYLFFGDKTYSVSVIKINELFEHYVNKAKIVSALSYDLAKNHDCIFKFNEYDIFSEVFRVKEIQDRNSLIMYIESLIEVEKYEQ